MTKPTLYIFSGLPGVGKSTLAKKLVNHVGAVYLRADTVEQGLRELCKMDVEGEGYRLCYRIANENLSLGNSVVADSVNPWDLTRKEWEGAAKGVGCRYINIEIVCSDQDEHRSRVETRDCDVKGLELPSWEQVLSRDYQEWKGQPVRIDTFGESAEKSFLSLCEKLNL